MARFDTTVSLLPEHIDQLTQAAEGLNVSVNRVVVQLYAAMMAINDKMGTPSGPIGRQAPTGEYKRMHLYLTPEEYEQKIDMRRLYKMSASMVLALAIEWFLEKIIACWYDSDQMNTIINVHFSQKHAIIPEYREESAQYRLIWGRSPS